MALTGYLQLMPYNHVMLSDDNNGAFLWASFARRLCFRHPQVSRLNVGVGIKANTSCPCIFACFAKHASSQGASYHEIHHT